VAYFLPVPKIFIPDPESRVEKDPRSGSASINFNLSILTQKLVA
jgi:hypothetical protein